MDSKGGPLLWAAHFCVLALTQGLDAVGRRAGLRRPLITWRGVRWMVAWPQLAAIAVRYRWRGPRRGIRQGAGRISLGYFAIGHKPARAPDSPRP